tara:strand:+ start:23885 stop:24571 length:687 start_codon:yes stop_codon:yes gene_type:complete
MKKLSKAEILQENINLKEDLRRIRRELNQALVDIPIYQIPKVDSNNKTNPSSHVDRALKRAEEEFKKDIKEPKNGKIQPDITKYIKSNLGLNWYWEEDYTKNNQFAWCGAFQSFIYQEANVSIRKNTFPSCYRMNRDWRNTKRYINDKNTLCKGDLVTVYTSSKRSPDYGNHIVLVNGLIDENGDFETIEGNAKGYGPNQDYREGVSKRTRNIKDIARIYRLLEEDFS